MRSAMQYPALWAILATAVLAGPNAALAQAAGPGFSDEVVERSIDKAKEFLWSKFNARQGHWPIKEQYEGGVSSLAALALLSAGESPESARMKKALTWLAQVETTKTYVLGIRAQVWTFLPQRAGRKLLAKDSEQLIKSICRPARPPVNLKSNPRYGSYTYTSAGKIGGGGDHSNTQYGILGVWAAARENLEVPLWYWQLVYKHFEAVQNPDGGWTYSGYKYGGVAGKSSATMTAAGLASVFVAFDNLQAGKFVQCGQHPVTKTIQGGLDWFEKNWRPGGGGYYMYGVERVGLACGYKYFGKKDWYKEGASLLVRRQAANGGWGDVVNTSFMLLFLVRGRAPVLFNRLEYTGDWNNRPRALANLTRWTGRQFEREVNWQIINLKVPVTEWHDAPILLITGSAKPTFSDAELDKLREFVWQGGLILSVAECKKADKSFDEAMRQVYAKLFPDYELRAVPVDHPLYNAHFKIKQRIPLWAVSNGVRILALHTDYDLPLRWQTNAALTQPETFRLAFNAVYFATDRASLRHRGTSPWPAADKPVIPLRVAKVARVRYKGNWDPEPLAWQRFGILMGQHWQTRVVTETVALEKLDPARHPVAVMTGTTRVTLDAAEKQALKGYARGGGTVILEAAGGSQAFADSATALLRELFGDGAVRRLPSFSPVYQLPGMEMGPIQYRRAARERLGRFRAARIMGVSLSGRVAVFLSREDLTSGLVGYPCFTCIGYSPGTAEKPGSAVRLMRNMVIYGNQTGKGPAQPPTPPLTTQASRQR